MKKRISLVTAVMILVSLFVLPGSPAQAASVRPRTATFEELEAANKTWSTQNARVKVIDGELWVWGVNNSSAFIGVAGKTEVPVPVKIDPSVFGGAAVKMAQINDWVAMAITEDGSWYMGMMDTWLKIDPVKYDGGKVVDMNLNAGTVTFKVQNNGQTQWWFGAGMRGSVDTCSCWRIDTQEFYDGMKAKTGKVEVIKNVYTAEYASDTCIILTESGEVFTYGSNQRSSLGNGMPTDSEDVSRSQPYHVTGRPEFDGRKIVQISMQNSTAAILDDKGTVWTWGNNARGKVGNGVYGEYAPWDIGANDVSSPYCAFGPGSAISPGKKARYILTTGGYEMAVLTDNNEIYAWGAVMTNMLGRKIAYPTESMQEITAKETIIKAEVFRAAIEIQGISGNTYFAGSVFNNMDGSGLPSGSTIKEPVKVEPETLPPIKPHSANKISMSIKTTDEEGKPVEYSTANGNTSGLDIRVGQQFTLNIYFEDFAQLTAFYLPISFDKKILQVTDLEGRVYDPASAPVHPGFNGKSGLRTKLGIGDNDPSVVNTTWINGVVSDNSRSPIVDNDNGFVLVEGAAKLEEGVVNRITGQVQMFSVEMKAIGETQIYPTVQTTGIDLDGNAKDPMWGGAPAKWYSTKVDFNGSGDVGKDGVWEFDNQDLFQSRFHAVEIIDMQMDLYRDEDSKVTDKATDGEGQPEYYRIDKRNTDSNYKVKAAVTPTEASWPDIETWSCEFMDGKPHPAGATVSDYITTLTGDHPNYYEFVVNDGLDLNSNVLDEDGVFVPAYLKITGYGDHIPYKDGKPEKSRTVYIKITNDVPAPLSVSIKNKDGYVDGMDGKFQVNETSKTELEKKGITLSNTYTFQAEFTAADVNDFSKDVKWQLLRVTERDVDGAPKVTVPLGTDAEAPLVIVPDSTNTDPNTPKCKLQAQNSTADDDDIILKISSSVDPKVSDYVAVKVRLAPYDITLPSESITLVYGTGVKQVYSLADNVQVVPGGAADYTLEYVKSVSVVDNRTGEELGGEGKRVAPNVTIKDDGTIEPVRSDKDYSVNSYDVVTVKIEQTLGGKPLTLTKTLNVYTVDAVPPPNMYVDVRNSAGVTNDYIKFSIGENKSQIEVGDTLHIYRDFADKNPVASYTPLTEAQVKQLHETGYNVPSREVEGKTYALNPAGGTVGYQLIKAGGTEYKKTPVMYNPKALKLSGFIKLDGKPQTKSSHDGITITITDVVGSDGKSISTTTKADGVLHGYFEFEQYISAKEHTMTISKANYLSRQIKFTMPSTADFEISTAEKPILLYPGDLDGKRGIQYDDLNEYRSNWVGRYKSKDENLAMLENFNFYDGDQETNVIINLNDLLIVDKRMGMTTGDYSPWQIE